MKTLHASSASDAPQAPDLATKLLAVIDAAIDYLQHPDGHHLPAKAWFTLNENLREVREALAAAPAAPVQAQEPMTLLRSLWADEGLRQLMRPDQRRRIENCLARSEDT